MNQKEKNDENVNFTSLQDLKLSRYDDEEIKETDSRKVTTRNLPQGTLIKLEDTVRASEKTLTTLKQARSKHLSEPSRAKERIQKFLGSHPLNNIILYINSCVRSHSSLRNLCFCSLFDSFIEPKSLNDALTYPNCTLTI